MTFLMATFINVSPVVSESLSENDIKKLALEAILENPQIVMDAINLLRDLDEANKETSKKQAYLNNKEILTTDVNAPSYGSPDADITIVEFFDYNCGYCKKVYPTILKLNKEFENVKIVFKEMPILGAPSLVKSKVSLAAFHVKPEKYIEAHGKIMNHRGQLNTVEDVANLLQSLGYDKDELIKKAESEMIANALEENKKLAFKLQVSGTPAFIVEDEFVDGAISFDGLKALVNKKIK